MGDSSDVLNEEFDDDELEALGEKPEVTESTETEAEGVVEVKPEVEETETDKHKPADDNLISQSKFDQRVKEIRGKAEQKLDLLKKDPDEYYSRYPDEKPAQKVADTIDEGALVITGGKYDGKTLNEVYRESPIDANKIYYNYLREQEKTAETKANESKRIAEESDREVNEFSAALSNELFGKDSSKLLPDEIKNVEKVLNDVLGWMEQTGRGGGILADAYALMNMGTKQKKAAADGATAVIDATNRGRVKTITSDIVSDEGLTGYEAYQNMTNDQLANEMDAWPEDKYNKFLKEAPEALKKKHPGLPWS